MDWKTRKGTIHWPKLYIHRIALWSGIVLPRASHSWGESD